MVSTYMCGMYHVLWPSQYWKRRSSAAGPVLSPKCLSVSIILGLLTADRELCWKGMRWKEKICHKEYASSLHFGAHTGSSLPPDTHTQLSILHRALHYIKYAFSKFLIWVNMQTPPKYFIGNRTVTWSFLNRWKVKSDNATQVQDDTNHCIHGTVWIWKLHKHGTMQKHRLLKAMSLWLSEANVSA